MLIAGVSHLQRGIKVHVLCPADFAVDSVLLLSAHKKIWIVEIWHSKFLVRKLKMLCFQKEMNDSE